MIRESVIACPHCAAEKLEVMPTDACRFFYTCTGCGATLRPKTRLLLRVLFVRLGPVPADPGQAFGAGRTALLRRIGAMAGDTFETLADMLNHRRGMERQP